MIRKLVGAGPASECQSVICEGTRLGDRGRRSGDRAEVGGEAVVVELVERDGTGEGVGAHARVAELGEGRRRLSVSQRSASDVKLHHEYD